MNPATKLLAALVALDLAADALFALGVFPGGTQSAEVRRLYARRRWVRWAFWGLALFLDWHFFGAD